MRFVTGFPGFLGSALVERLLSRTDDRIVCLVQDQYHDLASRRATGLLDAVAVADDAGDDTDENSDPDRIDLVVGDITEPDLGLAADDADRIRANAIEVYHLAAVYDLGVSRELGEAVNVRGTEHVLELAAGSEDLWRFHYVSTCYVSGRYEGVFTAEDLDVGQSFNNHYEETKFRAEVAVRERMGPDFPTTIYRPAVVVGDSETGETSKFNGPYYLLTLLRRQGCLGKSRWPPAVVPGPIHSDGYEFNVVPRDFVVDAIDRLARREDTANRCFQLCDPRPPTVADLIEGFADATDRRAVTVPTERRLLRTALERVPGVGTLSGVEPAAIDYFWHPTVYTNDSTREVLGEDAMPPRFADYVDVLVAYAREHPELDARAMV